MSRKSLTLLLNKPQVTHEYFSPPTKLKPSHLPENTYSKAKSCRQEQILASVPGGPASLASRLRPLRRSRPGPSLFHLLYAFHARCQGLRPGLEPESFSPCPPRTPLLAEPLPATLGVVFVPGADTRSRLFFRSCARSSVWNAPFQLVASYLVLWDRSRSALLTGSGVAPQD